MLNRDSHEALYLQLARLLDRAIEAGEYRPFDRLPTENELVAAHGVSRITVRRALDYLLERQRIVRKQGKGTFVAGPLVGRDFASLNRLADLLAGRRGEPDSVELIAWDVDAPPDRARRALATGAPALHRLVRRFHRGGRVLGLSETYFAPALGALDAETPPSRATCDLVETVAGEPIAQAEISVRLARLDAARATLLGLTPDAMRLVIERRSLASNRQPLEHTSFWLAAADVELRLERLGRFPIPDHLLPDP